MDKDKSSRHHNPADNLKNEQLDRYRVQDTGKPLTTNQGRKISNDSETLKAGERGPSLHEDWHFLRRCLILSRKSNRKELCMQEDIVRMGSLSAINR